MQFRTTSGTPLSHSNTSGSSQARRSHTFRTAASLASTLESTEWAWASAKVISLRIDGSLAHHVLRTADDVSEVFHGRDEAGRLDRLKFLHHLKLEAHEPLPTLPHALCRGDSLIYHWVDNPDVDLRSRILIMAEAIMLLCGLLLTVSADALFSNPCVLGESKTGTCSPLEVADLGLWVFMLATEAAALGTAAGTCNIISFLHDGDLRTWVLSNWVRYQSAQNCMTWTTMLSFPAAVVVRLSLNTPTGVRNAVAGGFAFIILFIFMGNWMWPFSSAIRISMGWDFPMFYGEGNFNAMNNIFIGASPHKYKMEGKGGKGGGVGAAKVGP